MPADPIAIALGCMIVALFGITYGIIKHKAVLKRWILSILIFGIAIVIGVFPWFLKNGMESQFITTPSINGILNGSGGSLQMDYTRIYGSDELKTIQEKNLQSTVTQSGQVLNEDFSRYFGQEQGINNYMKLPYNLTMQINQR